MTRQDQIRAFELAKNYRHGECGSELDCRLCDAWDELKSQLLDDPIDELLAALKVVVLSAHPRKSENPAMFQAWQLAHLVIARATGVNSALGIPDHICGICYHQFDQCSHCYDSGLEVCEVCGKPQQNGVWICDGCNHRATHQVTQHLQGPASGDSCRWCNGSGEDVEVDDNGKACTREMCQSCRGTGKVI